MRRQQIICIGLFMTLANCALYKADLDYEAKTTDEYYFPLFSAEFVKQKNDCVQRKGFSCNLTEPNDSLSEFVNQWYSKHLRSLGEPILYTLRNQDKKIIRFTHLGTWSKPFSYRIENNHGQITVVYNETNGSGGYGAGRRMKHKQRTIRLKTWEKVLRKIDQEDFWAMETNVPEYILDGEEWILEVLIDEKYHVVTRTSPDVYDGKAYAELCKLVMNVIKIDRTNIFPANIVGSGKE